MELDDEPLIVRCFRRRLSMERNPPPERAERAHPATDPNHRRAGPDRDLLVGTCAELLQDRRRGHRIDLSSNWYRVAGCGLRCGYSAERQSTVTDANALIGLSPSE